MKEMAILTNVDKYQILIQKYFTRVEHNNQIRKLKIGKVNCQAKKNKAALKS